MTDEVQDTPKSARSEGARNGWKTRQKNKQDAPAKVGGITMEQATTLERLATELQAAQQAFDQASTNNREARFAFDRYLDSLTAGK